MLRRSVIGAGGAMHFHVLHRRGRWTGWAMVIILIAPAVIALAPTAFADSIANVRNALASARAATSCGPLRSDPIVEQVAEVINRSTDAYVDHNTADQPIDDPMPGLKTLGYHGTKTALLRAVGKTEADAIRGMMLEGVAPMHDEPPAISNCSLTDAGISVRYNQSRGYLTAIVLAGP